MGITSLIQSSSIETRSPLHRLIHPGIRYVVDAGRSKQRLLEQDSGMARFEVRWISQASAAQRAGRAGRTGPGHTYRLFSSAHFNDTFPLHTPPEIANTALEGVVLVMKSMGVDKVCQGVGKGGGRGLVKHMRPLEGRSSALGRMFVDASYGFD